MTEDEVTAEIRQTRREFADKFDGDFGRMMADLRRRQEERKRSAEPSNTVP